MSGACKYWTDKRTSDGDYTCPWCARNLKLKLSNSEKNPGRGFLSCDTKFGGCGLFCFADAEPNEKFKPRGDKAAASGSIFGGNYAAKPSAENLEVATLKAKVATIESQLATIFEDIARLQGVRNEDEHSDHSNEAQRKRSAVPLSAPIEQKKKKRAD